MNVIIAWFVNRYVFVFVCTNQKTKMSTTDRRSLKQDPMKTNLKDLL